MIKPGLERIGRLLKDVELPWKSIHVAGTNGKGSICAHASALLTRRNVRVGRFSSPHTMYRWDGITIRDEVVDPDQFKSTEEHFLELNEKEGIGASPFEILTATAFQLFTKSKVDIGVVETGMGGTLDATNILNNQKVSVISKIGFDHQNFLGNTLAEIAAHKAGILRPGVPYLVDITNEWNVQQVIKARAEEIGAGPEIEMSTGANMIAMFQTKDWHKVAASKLPYQRDNMVLALFAVKEATGTDLGKLRKSVAALGKRVPGRAEFKNFGSLFGAKQEFLIDGAHNQSAAIELAGFVDRRIRDQSVRKRIIWVVAMTEGKDVYGFLSTLLNPGDSVVATSFDQVDGMPWVKCMAPQKIVETASHLNSNPVTVCNEQPGALRALITAKCVQSYDQRIVVTGSLYFVGQLLREYDQWKSLGDEYIDTVKLQKEESTRVNKLLSQLNPRHSRYGGLPKSNRDDDPPEPIEPDLSEELALQKEIDALDAKLARLAQEEDSLKMDPPHAAAEDRFRIRRHPARDDQTLETIPPTTEDRWRISRPPRDDQTDETVPVRLVRGSSSRTG